MRPKGKLRGYLGALSSLDQLVETLAQQAKALGLHIDLSYKFHDPGRFGGLSSRS